MKFKGKNQKFINCTMKIIEKSPFKVNGRAYEAIAELENGVLSARVIDVQSDGLLLFHKYGNITMKRALQKIEQEYRAIPRILKH